MIMHGRMPCRRHGTLSRKKAPQGPPLVGWLAFRHTSSSGKSTNDIAAQSSSSGKRVAARFSLSYHYVQSIEQAVSAV